MLGEAPQTQQHYGSRSHTSPAREVFFADFSFTSLSPSVLCEVGEQGGQSPVSDGQLLVINLTIKLHLRLRCIASRPTQSIIYLGQELTDFWPVTSLSHFPVHEDEAIPQSQTAPQFLPLSPSRGGSSNTAPEPPCPYPRLLEPLSPLPTAPGAVHRVLPSRGGGAGPAGGGHC